MKTMTGWKEKTEKEQWVIGGVACLLLILLYLVIFSFSGQDGETSGGLSIRISEKCVEIINNMTGKNWTEKVREEMAIYFEHPIRKLAHVCEYALMGILVYLTTRPFWKEKKSWYCRILIWVFLSAAADEFHQTFVPDRWGSPADVLLDTAGGLIGLVFMILVHRKKKS